MPCVPIAQLSQDDADRVDNATLIVVAGNSGSLLELPPQSEWSQDIYFIGVNRMLRLGLDGREYEPDLLIINDSRPLWTDRVYLANRPSRTRLVTGTILKDWDTKPPGVPLPAEVSSDYWMQLFNANGKPVAKSPPYPSVFSDRFVCIHNVTHIALQVALLLAWESAWRNSDGRIGRNLTAGEGLGVLLIGCENVYPPKQSEKPTHFYDVNQIDIDNPPSIHSAVPKKLRPFEPSRLYDDYHVALGHEFRKRDVRLADGGPWRGKITPDITKYAYADAKSSLLRGSLVTQPNDEEQANVRSTKPGVEAPPRPVLHKG